MAIKCPSFLFLLITALSSYQNENANGATYTDISIRNYMHVRVYVPNAYHNNKLPLVIYYHGGGFIGGSTTDFHYNNFIQSLVDHSNVVAFSVDYRLFDVSRAYKDSWSAIHYVASHSNGTGPNPTLNNVDFRKIFLSGDSSGGNIAHNMAMKIAMKKTKGLNIKGIALLCPYFWGIFPIGLEPIDFFLRGAIAYYWVAALGGINLDDTRINPLVDPKLGKIGANKILVISAFGDPLFYRGSHYARALRRKGYKGKVEHHSYIGMHDFFIFSRFGLQYLDLLGRLSSFFNGA